VKFDRLYSSYCRRWVRLSLAGFAGIVLLLLIFLRSPLAGFAGPSRPGAGGTDRRAGLVLMGRQLNLLHLIGML